VSIEIMPERPWHPENIQRSWKEKQDVVFKEMIPEKPVLSVINGRRDAGASVVEGEFLNAFVVIL
jgi:hypothetical protein